MKNFSTDYIYLHWGNKNKLEARFMTENKDRFIININETGKKALLTLIDSFGKKESQKIVSNKDSILRIGDLHKIKFGVDDMVLFIFAIFSNSKDPLHNKDYLEETKKIYKKLCDTDSLFIEEKEKYYKIIEKEIIEKFN